MLWIFHERAPKKANLTPVSDGAKVIQDIVNFCFAPYCGDMQISLDCVFILKYHWNEYVELGRSRFD